MKKVFPEERFVYDLLVSKYGAVVRFCSAEEDHGTRKADLAVRVAGDHDVFLQISRFPKSKRAREKLLGVGTYPIYVCNSQRNFDEGLVILQLNSTPLRS